MGRLILYRHHLSMSCLCFFVILMWAHTSLTYVSLPHSWPLATAPLWDRVGWHLPVVGWLSVLYPGPHRCYRTFFSSRSFLVCWDGHATVSTHLSRQCFPASPSVASWCID